MTYTERQLYELLDEVHSMPFGAAQIALVEQVVGHADVIQSEELAFAARMAAISAYVYGGEPAKSFVAFSWCLTEYDANPERYRRHTHTLMWSFKYMVGAMRKFPEIPLARAHAVLDDMERRWRLGGHSLHAVYTYRHVVAAHIGDMDAAADWYAQWNTAPRDALSDCVGCDPTTKAGWLAGTGRDEDAIALAEPVLAGRLTCVEQPQQILSALLQPYTRTGRLDAARDAHRRAYRALRNSLADLEVIADHIFFCAVTGNEAYGLEIVERHLPWLDSSPTPFATMRFAASASVLLSRLRDQGQGSLTVSRPEFRDRAAAVVEVGTLADELATVATSLAARFDARNGTDHQSAEIAKILAATPIVAHLPLRAVAAGAPIDKPAPSEAPEVPEVPADADADQLLDLAEHYLLHEQSAGVTAVEDAFDERFASQPLTALQRGRRADIRGLVTANSGDLGTAEIAWTSALDLFATAGDEVRRHATRSRLGLLMCQTDRGEVGLPIVADSTDFLIAAGPVERHCSAYQRLAYAYLMNGRPDDALTTLDQAVSVSESSEDPMIAYKLPAHRAAILADTGRLDDARVEATKARDLCRAGGYRSGIASTSWILGRIAQEDGDLDQAVAAYDEALGAGELPQFLREVRRQRASMLSGTSHASEAIEDLSAEVTIATAAGEDDSVRTARYHLAQAYLNAGRPLDATDELEDLIAGLAPDDLGIESVRHMLARAYRHLDQPDQAIEQLELIVGNAASRGFAPLVAEMNEQIAQILDQLDRDAPAAARFRVAADAYHSSEMPLEAVRAGRRAATSHMWAHQMDDALAALEAVDLRALDFTSGEPEARWERAMLGVDGARILAAADDLEAALIRCAPAISTFAALEDAGAAAFARTTFGEFLVRADRPQEAEPVLRIALAEGDESVQIRATQALIRALMALGRTSDAEELQHRQDRDE